MSFFRKNKIGLLPHESKNIYGITPQSSQFFGWELLKFDIPECWSKTQGENVTVAVLDTGCDLNHVDLKDNLLNGKNFINPSKPPQDVNGHGSHVAGTIAAVNNKYGISGVAPKTKIVPVKVLSDNGSGSMKPICDGIVWSADQGVDFITMSLGCSYGDKKLKKAIDYAESKGTVCFCAAGNSGPSVDIMYPARYNNVIAIGAIDQFFRRTSFSCAGESMDFLAPGEDIISCIPDNRYASMSGTSMSNPFATGCAALLLSWNRKHKRYILKTAQDYINVFAKFSKKLTNSNHQERKYQGNGILFVDSIF